MRLATSLVVLATSGGCLTAGAWSWANRTGTEFRGGEGIINDERSGRSLVFKYTGDNGGVVEYLIVPLRADGRPVPPFDGGEIAANGTSHWALVDSGQRTAILADAMRGLSSGPLSASLRYSFEPGTIPVHGATDDIIAMAYRLTADGNVKWISIPSRAGDASRPATIPGLDLTGARVVFLPGRIAFTEDNMIARKSLATVATPVTVVADAGIAVAFVPVAAAIFCYVAVYAMVHKGPIVPL